MAAGGGVGLEEEKVEEKGVRSLGWCGGVQLLVGGLPTGRGG